METYRLVKEYTPRPKPTRHGIIAAAFRTFAAAAAMATLVLAILPPSDTAAIQQTLAITAMHPVGPGRPDDKLARA